MVKYVNHFQNEVKLCTRPLVQSVLKPNVLLQFYFTWKYWPSIKVEVISCSIIYTSPLWHLQQKVLLFWLAVVKKSWTHSWVAIVYSTLSNGKDILNVTNGLGNPFITWHMQTPQSMTFISLILQHHNELTWTTLNSNLYWKPEKITLLFRHGTMKKSMLMNGRSTSTLSLISPLEPLLQYRK